MNDRDPIRSRCIDQMYRRGLTLASILDRMPEAQRDAKHIKAFLSGRASMGSARLSLLLEALDLELKEKPNAGG